jgi:hypothetical protein
MDFSWKSFGEPEADADLRGVIGYLHPTQYRTVSRVLWNTRQIEAQLAESKGLVGYSLRAKLFPRRFWAVAVWENDESLQSFVEGNPHAGIRSALKGAMEESWFKTFDVKTEEVPIDIDEAITRVE